MECSHIYSSVKISRDLIKIKKSEFAAAALTNPASTLRTWKCLGEQHLLFFRVELIKLHDQKMIYLSGVGVL